MNVVTYLDRGQVAARVFHPHFGETNLVVYYDDGSEIDLKVCGEAAAKEAIDILTHKKYDHIRIENI